MVQGKKKIAIYIIASLIAAAICVISFGKSVMDPTNMNLYYKWGDGMQHYYGWMAFRNSPWKFPLGLFDGVTYPDATSIIFTDSLPWLAILFKLLSPILPWNFQYFGIWAIFCYVMMAILIVKILSDYTQNPIMLLASVVMMSYISSVIIRQFSHEALGGQWILLLAWDLFLDIYKNKATKKLVAKSALIGFLASGTHIYFLPMCGIILVGGMVLDFLKNKEKLRPIVLLGTYLCVVVLSVWILGGFSSGTEIVNEEFTYGNMANLNTLWNPVTYSAFFKGLGLYSQGQDDGSAYLGLGFFFVIACDLVLILWNRKKAKHQQKEKVLVIPLVAIFVMTLWFSTYPLVCYGEKILFSTKLPGIVDQLMSVFRCCGRAAWVVSFGIMIFSFILLCRENKRLISIFLIVAALLQGLDVQPVISKKYTEIHEENEQAVTFSNAPELLEAVAEGKYKHVVIHDELNSFAALFVASWAIEHHMTVNTFYLARSDEAAYEKRLEEALLDLEDDTLYLFSPDDRKTAESYGLTVICEDDGILVTGR